MIRFIQKWITNTFGFSRSETNGSLILIGFVLLIAILPRWFINSQKSVEVSAHSDKIKLQEWYNGISFSESEVSNEIPENSPKQTPILRLKSFDPNVITLQELLSMGIPGNVSNNLISYRNAGGSFAVKMDLQKIYGMSESLYDKLEGYLILPDIPAKPKFPEKNITTEVTPSESETISPPIAINTASASELEVIRGIGPILSERIIKYRDLLGGFHSTDQLHEVYGLNEEVISEILKKITVDSIQTAININAEDLQGLSSHPYIDYKVARAIINYKTVHGSFREKSDLKKIKIVSDSLYNKLSPYISVRP